MPGASTVENNFTKGLLTEFTGLNFPENAATDTNNCVYSLVGDVSRRQGMDFEANAVFNPGVTGVAINNYKWNNAGGDGETQVLVNQLGSTLYFYQSSNATITNPLSTTLLASSVDITAFTAAGNQFDFTSECEFADGNGYLFVYHPTCDPFYCTYNAGTITGNLINLQIRDFVGIQENIPTTQRPATLSSEHLYNLCNQGWTSGSEWIGTSSTSRTISTGNTSFFIQTGLTIPNGTNVAIYVGPIGTYPQGTEVMAASVTSYDPTTGGIGVSVYAVLTPALSGNTYNTWTLVPSNVGYINTWFTEVGNYPSNADVWWYFKDDTDFFNPAATNGNVSLGSSQAPQGHFIYNAFNINRSVTSSISGLTTISTTARPTNGCWFQGRVWYTGINAQQPATGDASYYTWTENIYFSQIVTDTLDFGNCYQSNDPTSENLFDLLPTDGGVITIQGAGSIYKLFPVQNALLVFAANGVWYITGSQGIGFTANDYTIVKLSSVRSISTTSFVDILGVPMFWNEEGIYQVTAAKQGSALVGNPLHINPIEVSSLTVGTIVSFYNDIPLQSKKYARGDYDPVNYIVQWCYKSENETGIMDRYSFDSMLNFNTYNQAFYPYSFSNTPVTIQGINYIVGPGGSSSPAPVFKYFTTTGEGTYSFSEENSTLYIDWPELSASDYDSYFTTGFRVHGQGQRRFQMPYIYVFSRADTTTAYTIQGLWDYANNSNANRWSVAQVVYNYTPNYGMVFKRHKIRGRGVVLQIKVNSVSGQPFDIMGWSSFENINASV